MKSCAYKNGAGLTPTKAIATKNPLGSARTRTCMGTGVLCRHLSLEACFKQKERRQDTYKTRGDNFPT